MQYPFNLIKHKVTGSIEDPSILAFRPFTNTNRSFEADARNFVPGSQLETSINTAIAVGEPLLITGEPGTGKTQAAYYAAYKLGVEPVIHFQVKSETTAQSLLYHFDTIRYFHDAHLQNINTKDNDCIPLDKKEYVEPRSLWHAFEQAEKNNAPRVILIDEIDKAPRDFPNDLLHELDKMEFTVVETNEKISVSKEHQPIVFITSNSERRLPEPFLRRCVYHHIRFDDRIVEQAVKVRQNEFKNLSPEFIKMALRRFLALRDLNLRKKPATGELLVWLRVLALAVQTNPEHLDYLEEDLSKLPYLGVLLKNHQDIEEMV